MHGLINRTIERFVRDTYGRDTWLAIANRLELGFTEFEAMLTYDDEITWRLLDEIAASLGKGRDEVLEDVGTFLVSHPKVEALRRLLRFGGVTFSEFLNSLDDLPARVRLAVADLNVPQMELREYGGNVFNLTVDSGAVSMVGFGHLMTGLLRAMADDYGALVILEHKGVREGFETIDMRLLEVDFALGRRFELGAQQT